MPRVPMSAWFNLSADASTLLTASLLLSAVPIGPQPASAAETVDAQKIRRFMGRPGRVRRGDTSR